MAPDPAPRSQALYMTNMQDNKLHLIKSRFQQMWFKTLKTPIDIMRLTQVNIRVRIGGARWRQLVQCYGLWSIIIIGNIPFRSLILT